VRIAIGDAADDYADRDARAFDAGRPVMDARIDADPVTPIHVKTHLRAHVLNDSYM
jgi:hypothetical protein